VRILLTLVGFRIVMVAAFPVAPHGTRISGA
jgi:hypothetical protein